MVKYKIRKVNNADPFWLVFDPLANCFIAKESWKEAVELVDLLVGARHI